LVFACLLLPLIGLGDWSLQPPSGAVPLALFVVSMAASVALSAAITTLLNASVVSMLSDQGINTVTNSLVIILSGMVIPLPLFPERVQTLLLLQPFAGLVDIPYRIYLGNLSGRLALGGIALQVLWTIVLIGFGRLLLARTMRRVNVQGG